MYNNFEVKKMFDAKAFSELLKTAIGANRSITDFSRDCKVVRPYISKFVNCKLDKAPSPEVIKKFADAAANNVQETDFLHAAGYLSPNDSIDAFNIMFGPMLEGLEESESFTRKKLDLQYHQNDDVPRTSFEVPILSFIDPDTIIALNQENVNGYNYIPRSDKYDSSKCFYYIANDQSMFNARIHEDDEVLIIPDKPYNHNDIVLIFKNSKEFLRRYKKLNSIHLFMAENNDFDSFDATNADLKKFTVKIIGTVEEVKTKTTL